MNLDILNSGLFQSNRFFEPFKITAVCAIIAVKVEQIFIKTVAELLMHIERILQKKLQFLKILQTSNDRFLNLSNYQSWQPRCSKICLSKTYAP